MSIEKTTFPISSKEEWLEKIVKDLKGKDFEETLTRYTRDGLKVEAVHYPDNSFSDHTPGKPPYHRGNKAQGNDFSIQQTFDLDQKNVNHEILNSLNQNVGSLLTIGSDFERGLKDVTLPWIKVGFQGPSNKHSEFISYCKTHESKDFFIDFDPIISGDSSSLSAYLSQVKGWKTEYPEAYFISIGGNTIANAGGSTVSELSYALLAGHECLSALIDVGLSTDQAAASIRFNFSLGPDFFVEIAKLKAFRRLWASVVNPYKPESDCSHNCWITAETVRWNKTPLDQENNLLRATTEGISGILGGADTIQINPLNLTSNEGEINRRMAINILNLLGEESYMAKVADPTGGSYVVESLSIQIASRVWEIFKESEAKGGIKKDLKSLLNRVDTEKNQLISMVENGEIVLLGANKHLKEGDHFDPKNHLTFETISL